jgi:hypothetical protein
MAHRPKRNGPVWRPPSLFCGAGHGSERRLEGSQDRRSKSRSAAEASRPGGWRSYGFAGRGMAALPRDRWLRNIRASRPFADPWMTGAQIGS